MLENNIIVSFCIPTYNREDYVVNCVNEIRKIKSERIEIIISDNASEDNTSIKLNELEKIDKRIKLYRNNINLGQSKNIAKVFSYASGKYIYLTSDEDLVNPKLFNSKLELFDLSNSSLIFGSIIDKESGEFYIKEKNHSYSNLSDIASLDMYIYRHYLSGIMFKRDLLDIKQFSDYVDDERNLYAYIPALIMCAAHGNISTFSEPICFKQISSIQYTDYDLKKIKSHYTHPISRVDQIFFLKSVVYDYIKDNITRKKYLNALGVRAFRIYTNHFFLRYDKKDVSYFFESIGSDDDLRLSFKTHLYIYKIKKSIKFILGFLNLEVKNRKLGFKK